MTKTETAILASISKKGFFVGQGKRAMNAARKLYAEGKISTVTVHGFNANADKSQWNSPRFEAAYEIYAV